MKRKAIKKPSGCSQPATKRPRALPSSKAVSTRLLRVLPDLRQGLIQCEMWDVSITLRTNIVRNEVPTKLHYKCLSYVWGSPRRGCRSILVRGTRLEIRTNLWNFLNCARTVMPMQPLWIDAICIDQSNVAERSHVVQRMGDIYASASCVIIWLGSKGLGNRTMWEEMNTGRTLDNSKIMSRYFEESVKILCHEYWTRLWIMQEVLLAKKIIVMSGHNQIPWSRLEMLKNASQSGCEAVMVPHSEAETTPFGLIHGLRIQRLKYRVLKSLMNLLQVSSTAKCVDVKDRIYGVLSLVRNGRSFPVDYSKDTVNLFWNALAFIDEPRNLQTNAMNLLKTLELETRDLRNRRFPAASGGVSPSQTSGTGGSYQHVLAQFGDHAVFTILETEIEPGKQICRHCDNRVVFPHTRPGSWLCCVRSLQTESPGLRWGPRSLHVLVQLNQMDEYNSIDYELPDDFKTRWSEDISLANYYEDYGKITCNPERYRMLLSGLLGVLLDIREKRPLRVLYRTEWLEHK